MPGSASQIVTDGLNVYVLSDQPAGPDKYIWCYCNGAWSNLGGQASQIAVAGALYAINSLGGIYIRTNDGSWAPIAGGASAIATTPDGSVYVVSNAAGTDRAIWHYKNLQWDQMPGSGVAVVASNDAHSYALAGGPIHPYGVYVLNSAGAIYYLNADGSYARIPASASAVAPTADGGLFALAYPSSAGGSALYYFNFATQAWTSYPGLATSIAYDGRGSNLYAVASNGAIYSTLARSTPTIAGVRVDTDPFSDPAAQHATEVEPSAFAVGNTIVAAYQAGRFQSGGAAGTGVATSFDGGRSWTAQSLPGITKAENPANTYTFGSDPVVTYDLKHTQWLVTSLAIVANGDSGPAFVVSRSHDGVSWAAPLNGPIVIGPDKPWIGCDNTASSPHFGNCYAGWENGYGDGVMYVATTSDAGAMWSDPVPIATSGFSIGITPTVRPDGTIVAPYYNESADRIAAVSSSDGGATWSAPVTIGSAASSYNDRTVRSSYAPSVAMDSTGTIYALWESYDALGTILFAKTSDGTHWSSPPGQLPIGAGETGKARLIASLGADPNASGHLGVTYYVHDDATCSGGGCPLSAYLTASNDGGVSWSAPTLLAGPIRTDSLAHALSFSGAGTTGMLGDYDATVYVGGNFVSIFASAAPVVNGTFDEAIFASATAEATTNALAHARTHAAPATAPARSTHPFVRILPPD